ncbi:MAG: hypothetical protein E7607_01035 [Ruminococcaceae bacterium]|nr:hypothetical protein [Oscillospiraceae bacterium]
MNENVKEMARDLCECYVDHDATFDAEATAEKMVAKGYHKQIEGEWEFVEKEAFWISGMEESLRTGKPTKALMPVCSCCKTMFGRIVLEYKLCPECGARMKGVPDEN